MTAARAVAYPCKCVTELGVPSFSLPMFFKREGRLGSKDLFLGEGTIMSEPRFTCSIYALAAGVVWVVAFALIAIGWAVDIVYVSLLGVGLIGAAASITVGLCCWRVGRNIGIAYELGRDSERYAPVRRVP